MLKTITSIFLFLAILFTAQPLLNNQLMASALSACRKMECCGDKRKADTNKCGNEGCCLCMGFVSGNFYLIGCDDYSFPGWTIPKKKWTNADDHRLSKGISESWHPPEYSVRIG